jgi:transposase
MLPRKTLLKKLPISIQEAQVDRKPDDHRAVIFMVQDEARFGRITQPTRCWAPTGMRPCIPHQIVRQAIYAFTAVEPKSGKMVSLLLPTANTEMMTIFLEHVSKEFAKSFIVMQVDRASWHRSPHLRLPENIRLIFQPPYSPEVNPVEHIWGELREKHFSNRIFSSLDSLQDHLCNAINELSSDHSIVRSITYFPHIRVACEKAS